MTALTHTLTQEARDKLPKDQLEMICATSAEAVYLSLIHIWAVAKTRCRISDIQL